MEEQRLPMEETRNEGTQGEQSHGQDDGQCPHGQTRRPKRFSVARQAEPEHDGARAVADGEEGQGEGGAPARDGNSPYSP